MGFLALVFVTAVIISILTIAYPILEMVLGTYTELAITIALIIFVYLAYSGDSGDIGGKGPG